MTVLKFQKFTKEDIHAKRFSDEIDDAIFRALEKIDVKLVSAVLANRIGQTLQSLPDDNKEKLIEFCHLVISKKAK